MHAPMGAPRSCKPTGNLGPAQSIARGSFFSKLLRLLGRQLTDGLPEPGWMQGLLQDSDRLKR